MRRPYFRDRGLALAFATLTGVTGLLAAPALSAAAPGQEPIVEVVDVAGAQVFGPIEAPATLVIFADLGSAAASGLGVILHGLTERYPTELKVYFRHTPAADRPERMLAHQAALAAGEQGKFWEMLDLLLSSQARHGRAQFSEMAAQLELDAARFSADIDGDTARQRISADQGQATVLKVAASPTFFVNGVRMTGRKTLTDLAARIDAALAAGR